MGNINSHNPSTDSHKPPRFPAQNNVDEKRSCIIRYITIRLEQGRLGKNIAYIIKNCVRDVRAQKALVEYIEAVFAHIHTQVQEGKLDEVKGERAVLAVLWATRWPHMAYMTSEERIEWETVRADAISRLSVKARQGW